MNALIVIAGPPGSGKSTLARSLESDFGIARIRPLTTRAPRDFEQDSLRDYQHVSRSDMDSAIRTGQIAFWDSVAGAIYGVLTRDITRRPFTSSVILPAARILEVRKLTDVQAFFLRPSGGIVELERRLRVRGESEEGIRARLEWGKSDSVGAADGSIFHVLGDGSPKELGMEVIRIAGLEIGI